MIMYLKKKKSTLNYMVDKEAEEMEIKRLELQLKREELAIQRELVELKKQEMLVEAQLEARQTRPVSLGR